MGDRVFYELTSHSNPREVSAKARALVSEIQAGMTPQPDMNVTATLAANAVAQSLFWVSAITRGLTKAEAEAACLGAISNLERKGLFDDPPSDARN